MSDYIKVYTSVLILLFWCITCIDRDSTLSSQPEIHQPNIVIFYVDDLGFQDLSCYGAQGVSTPNVDELAKKGLRFTDAHSPAATCTPSRYSLLTGEYAFRNQAKVLPGNAPLLIDVAKPTLPKMLKRAGYQTAVVGKWHLGLGKGDLDWNGKITPGPLEIGFDYSFLLPATGDRVPTVYIENHSVVGLEFTDPLQVSYDQKVGNRPTGTEAPHLLRYAADPQHSQTIVNGVSRIGYMGGGEHALWRDEDFAEVFTEKALQFVFEAASDPFFLFFSFHDIHVPRLPHPRFAGVSTMGPRGDAIAQMDWMTGKIIEELKTQNLLDNTLIIFTSDNGPVLNDGYEDQAVEQIGGHTPAGSFRGGKYSAFEAGTRVPMIVHWPAKIAPGETDALISQIDLYASIGKLAGVPLLEQEALDSKNLLEPLLGNTTEGREYLLEESFTLGIRQENWKYISPFDESKPIPQWVAGKGIEGGFDYAPQLYDLSIDPGEQNNIAATFPEKVLHLEAKITEIKLQAP